MNPEHYDLVSSINVLQLIVNSFNQQEADGTKIEYRVWNPFRSKLAAAVIGGVENCWVKPETRVLYLGAASGTSVSHVSDIIGPVSNISLDALLEFSFFCPPKIRLLPSNPLRKVSSMPWNSLTALEEI